MNVGNFHSFRPSHDRAQIEAYMGKTLKAIENYRGSPDVGGPWYEFGPTNAVGEAEISIYNFIGLDGVTADQFIRDLNKVSANKITLRINSPGGDVDDGIAIFNALKRHRAEVHVVVDSLAASAASFVAMAGDKVSMSPHAKMMIHDAQVFLVGAVNAADLRDLAEVLDIYSDDIAAMYADRAGGTTEEWRAVMKASKYYHDHEAVAAGLADEVVGSSGPAPANVKNEAPSPEPQPEPAEPPEEPSPDPEPVDYSNLFADLQREAEEALLV